MKKILEFTKIDRARLPIGTFDAKVSFQKSQYIVIK